MRKIEIKTYQMGESLFAAIIFLIFGIFLITDPKEMIKIALYILGGFITLLGVFKLLFYYKSSQDSNKKEIVTGGFFIIIGMSLILCTAIFYDTIETVLRFLMAIYLLYVGVNRLVSAFKVKESKKAYFINAGIIIAIAVALAAIPNLPLFVMGWIIVLYAIVEIVGFVLGRKSGNNIEVKEAVIIKEQIENKTNSEDIKLLK
ncbi:MAG: DUF308 domain-containing protein [Bacilli bacterium]|nr:DUF308 domain-containing protein [Bacilli bacterium]